MAIAGDIAMRALRKVFQHRRDEVLQCQQRDIADLIALVPGDPHLDRMVQRSYTLCSIEYCEDVIVHLHAVVRSIKDAERRRRTIDAERIRQTNEITRNDRLCTIVCDICEDVRRAEEDFPRESMRTRLQRRSRAMFNVRNLFHVFVVTPDRDIRPWAAERLNVRDLSDCYRSMEPEASPYALDVFDEIRDLLNARIAF